MKFENSWLYPEHKNLINLCKGESGISLLKSQPGRNESCQEEKLRKKSMSLSLKEKAMRNFSKKTKKFRFFSGNLTASFHLNRFRYLQNGVH